MNPISAEGTFDVEVKAYGETRVPGQVLVGTPFEANSVSPNTNIDIAGGDTLTIIGRGFPTELTEIEVVLDNAGET